MKENEGGANAAANTRDVSSRTIFHNPVLTSQFLRDYVDIPILKNVQPEDIEDESEKYQAYLGIEFEADTVKRIRLRGEGIQEDSFIYLISLIEHKSTVDYNVAMQILRYITCIWTEYAKEMEKKKLGNPATKAFRYPPILPIVYYEGSEAWTADMHLKDRILMNEIFEEYLPDFTYKLVRIHGYSNEELMSKEDEMSLIMLINKVQNVEDFKSFYTTSRELIELVYGRAPKEIQEIVITTLWGLFMKMNVPVEEAKQYIKMVKENRMGYLFENVHIDIQAERRNTQEQRERAEKAEEQLKEAEKHVDEVQRHIEEMARILISTCQEHGDSKEDVVRKINEQGVYTVKEAEELVDRFWK